MNCGAQLVRSVANDTNNIAGDGTTTATVLTRAIYKGGIKAVAAGMNPMDLKRGIDLAVEKVLVALKSMTQPISTPEEISAVCFFATIPPPPLLGSDVIFGTSDFVSMAEAQLCSLGRFGSGLRCQC